MGGRVEGVEQAGQGRMVPVPSVISEGNAKGAARTHAHTQKRARRQNRPSMAAQLLRGPLEPQPSPTDAPHPHRTASSEDHRGQLPLGSVSRR